MPDIVLKRLFVAVELPAHTKTRLKSLIKEMQGCGADAKWVAPENIHCTLKFLNQVPEDRIEEIVSVIKNTALSQNKFSITLDRLGGFPADKALRVVWAGFKDSSGTLSKLAGTLDQGLNKLRFEKKARLLTGTFQPHATLARIKSERNKIALLEKINECNKDFKPQELNVDNITLFESRLTPHGPTYNIIYQAQLS